MYQFIYPEDETIVGDLIVDKDLGIDDYEQIPLNVRERNKMTRENFREMVEDIAFAEECEYEKRSNLEQSV